ncbi:tautomerase family protein [Amorphus sp. MBR-141]
MAIVTIQIGKGRPITEKRELVKKVTQVVATELKLPPEWITILIHEFERENWASDGELHIDKFGPGYGTQGTGR